MKNPTHKITVWEFVGDEEEIVKEYLSFGLKTALELSHAPLDYTITVSIIDNLLDTFNETKKGVFIIVPWEEIDEPYLFWGSRDAAFTHAKNWYINRS